MWWLNTSFPWIGLIGAVLLLGLLFGTEELQADKSVSRWRDLTWLSWAGAAALKTQTSSQPTPSARRVPLAVAAFVTLIDTFVIAPDFGRLTIALQALGGSHRTEVAAVRASPCYAQHVSGSQDPDFILLHSFVSRQAPRPRWPSISVRLLGSRRPPTP
jgi:hypothetical protein